MAPRPLTKDEVRENFLQHCRDIVTYWSTLLDRDDCRTVEERVSGAVFSLLVALDGGSVAVPGFVVAPNPHPDDEAYCAGAGLNWYPCAPRLTTDIAGSLHESFYKKGQ